MLIITVSIIVTVAMAAIWFSPVVDNFSQDNLNTSLMVSPNVANVNSGYYVNNTIWNFLAAESQANGQFAKYKLDSAFVNWYVNNVMTLPSTNRGLTQQNISLIFKVFVLSDGNAGTLVQNAVNSEPVTTTINVTSKGTTTSDPYVMETETTIYTPILFWSVVWEVKLANILRFDNYQNALNFKNFAVSSLIGTVVYDDIMTGLFFSVVGGVIGMYSVIWGLIAGLLGTAVGDIAGSTNPTTVAGNVNTLFNNQEATYGYFEVVYELDYYPYLVTQAYSVYGPIIGGSINLFSMVNPLDIFGTTELNDYIAAFGDFQNSYGLNNWVYLSPPSSWTTYFGY